MDWSNEMNQWRRIFGIVVLAIALVGCGSDEPAPVSEADTTLGSDGELEQDSDTSLEQDSDAEVVQDSDTALEQDSDTEVVQDSGPSPGDVSEPDDGESQQTDAGADAPDQPDQEVTPEPCGDGVCDGSGGEDCATCATDCGCDDGEPCTEDDCDASTGACTQEPVVVTATESAKLLISDAGDVDLIGSAVALSGDTLLVGAQADDENGENAGAVYVFIRTGDTWSEQAKLLAPGGEEQEWFGSSVALDGDRALVGAIGDDANGGFSGAAYLFVRDGATWTLEQKLLPSPGWSSSAGMFASGGTAGDVFGTAVALDGDRAIVGADGDDDLGAGAGAVYYFFRTDGEWFQTDKLFASNGAAGEHFGRSVALEHHGNVCEPFCSTAVVGAATGCASGKAYVFVLTGAGWSEQTQLTPADQLCDNRFGFSVAMKGATVLVGAPKAEGNDGDETGAAYVFTRTDDAWTEEAKLLALDGDEGDRFGDSVALHGDTALVGAKLDDVDAGPAGSAYLFTRADASWTQQAKLLASDGGSWSGLGASVALSEDTALVGADQALLSVDPDVNSGAAYIFEPDSPGCVDD